MVEPDEHAIYAAAIAIAMNHGVDIDRVDPLDRMDIISDARRALVAAAAVSSPPVEDTAAAVGVAEWLASAETAKVATGAVALAIGRGAPEQATDHDEGIARAVLSILARSIGNEDLAKRVAKMTGLTAARSEDPRIEQIRALHRQAATVTSATGATTSLTGAFVWSAELDRILDAPAVAVPEPETEKP